jgi:nucleotide-binding universal stress UspA family protein
MATATKPKQVKSVILVGIDFSNSARDVLRAAADLARRRSAELHLVHVTPHARSESTATISADRPLEVASEADGDHARLELLAKEVADLAPRVVLHTRVGRADREIAQLARDVAADLLVVGTGQPRAIEHFLLGSVADSLVRHAPCPVLAHRAKVVPIWDKIEPPCADCLAVQQVTQSAQLWCERHSEHHPRAHTYEETPPSYGIGAQTFRQG